MSGAPKSDGGIGWQAFILRWGLRLLGATWRIREEIPEECRPIVAGEEPAVVAFWHGAMLPVWYRFRGGRHAALISGSRDGELLYRYLSRSLGYREVIRGSSSKGGSEALGRMVAALRERPCLITPDGPRGPAGEAKPGALIAAARSGRRVLLVGWECRRAIQLNSWDRMRIPFPFSVINFRYCIFGLPTSRGETKDLNEGIADEKLETAGTTEAGTTKAGAIRIVERDLRAFERSLSDLSAQT